MRAYTEPFKNLAHAIDNDPVFDCLSKDDKARVLSTMMHEIDSNAKEARQYIKSSKHYKGRYSFKQGKYIK